MPSYLSQPERETQITVLIISTKLTLKEIEKITSLLAETLSNSLSEDKLEIDSTEIRVSSSRKNGKQVSKSLTVSF